jgi:hypothetical protein
VYDRKVDDDGWTSADLLDEARHRGYSKASSRLIVDWTELGLLDTPKRRGTGRGSKPAVWSDNQAELFFTLLNKRRTVKRLATLYPIPVFIWLGWGEGYVPIRQVRKVMRSFVARRGKTSATAAANTADDYFRTLGVKRPTPIQRDNLNQVLSKLSAAHRSELGHFQDQLDEALRAIIAPNGTRLTLPTIDNTIWAINCRLAAAAAFQNHTDERQLPDLTFQKVQFEYSQTAPAYIHANPWQRDERLAELANGACSNLLFLLGRTLTTASPPVWAEP